MRHDPEFEAPAADTPIPDKDEVDPAHLAAHEGMSLVGKDGEVIKLETAEKLLIEFAIDRYDGKIAKIARQLGIGRSTLYRKMHQYGLEPEEVAD